jgi:hypothetical protein
MLALLLLILMGGCEWPLAYPLQFIIHKTPDQLTSTHYIELVEISNEILVLDYNAHDHRFALQSKSGQ